MKDLCLAVDGHFVIQLFEESKEFYRERGPVSTNICLWDYSFAD